MDLSRCDAESRSLPGCNRLGKESFGLGQPGAAGSVSLTPVWSQPGNYANVYITGRQASSENSNSDNLDLGIGGANSQAYLWFDFSSQLPVGGGQLAGHPGTAAPRTPFASASTRPVRGARQRAPAERARD